MSPLKKGIILQKETVETVGSFVLCSINPQLKLGVNSKLRRHRTVLTVSEFLVLYKIQFKFQPFLSKLINE